MNIDLVLAKREYVLQKKIIDKETIAKVWLIFRDANINNNAVFDVYDVPAGVPVSWELIKYDTTPLGSYTFPKNVPPTIVTVVNYVNSMTRIGLKPEDIAFVDTSKPDFIQVMISLDSMYFSNSFIMRIK